MSTPFTSGEGSSISVTAPLSPKHESNTGKIMTTPKELKEPTKPKDPKACESLQENNAENSTKKSQKINASKPTTAPKEAQEAIGSKTAKQTKVKAPKAPKPPKAPEKTFYEKLGDELADGLVKDPRSLGNSLNLVDRVSFVKLPQAAAIQVDEEEDDESPDASLASDFQAAGGIVPKLSKEEKKMSKSYEPRGLGREIYDLNDFTALASLQDLISRYGRVSHMGILDKSYIFFITKDRKAALYYKIKNKVAVVGGDPLCPPHLFPFVLSEFKKYRKKWDLGLAFLGAGQTFVDYARTQKYTTMCFAFERVLNPMTNPVLHSNAGKSILRISRNLLDPKKDNLTIEVYTPSLGKNALLQQQLVDVYEAWRNARNESGRPQAYITVYDPFALPELMTYIYTKSPDGLPNGFAALRILGAEKGYHLDPYVAAPGAPKGITDLLIYGTMSLLNTAKISYLSLGYEPLDDLGEICGIPKAFQSISRKVHKRIFDGLRVAGKKDYHDKFHPDIEQQQNLYLVFPPGIPSLKHMSAVVHVANIKLRTTIFKLPPLRKSVSEMFARKEKEGVVDGEGKEEGVDETRLSVGSMGRSAGRISSAIRSLSAPGMAPVSTASPGQVNIIVSAATN
jgi:hypothetical protein